MAELFFLPRQRALTDNVSAGAGWKLNFYKTGTTTRKDTFSDDDLTTANANPVVADANGEFGAIYLSGSYKVVLTDDSDVEQWTEDPINAPGGSDEEWREKQSVTFDSSTSFVVTGDPTDQFGNRIWHVHRRVAVSGSATGDVFGTISSVSVATDTTVTLDPITDSDGASATLSNESLTAWVGMPSAETMTSLPLEWILGMHLPEFHGALRDGTTDDRAAIESALSAAAGGVTRLLPGTYRIKTDLTLSDSHTTLMGFGHQTTTGSQVTLLLLDDGVKITTSGSDGTVGARHMTIQGVRIERVSGSTSTTPVVELLGAPDTKLKGVFITPDDKTNGTALRIRHSWNLALWDVWLWTAKYGLDGTSAVNAIRVRHANINAVQFGIVGGYNTLTLRESTIQQYTQIGVALGRDYEAITAESSTAPVIEDCYFETETGGAREIDLGNDTWVRNPVIRGNYFAHVTNSGTQAPIKLHEVYGFRITNNFWTGYTAADFCELEYHTASSQHFPQGRIELNNDLYTNAGSDNQIGYTSGITEAQKFDLHNNENLISRNWNSQEIGRQKTVRVPLEIGTSATTYHVAIMRGEHYGEVEAINVVSDGSPPTAGTSFNVKVGIAASNGFYADEGVSSFSSYSAHALTLANTRIHNDNRIIAAEVTTSGSTTAGRLVFEVIYHAVVE